MPWIELNRECRIRGVNRLPGWRTEVGRRLASVLLDRGDAELAPGPYDTRSGQGYDRSELALQEIDGIGDATAQAVYAYLDARRIVRPDTLLEIDLNVLPDVDDDLAEDIRAHLSGEGAGDG